MPRKERYQQIKLKRLLNANLDDFPEHIKKSLGQPSKINLKTDKVPAIYSYRGIHTNKRGEVWLPADHGMSANKKRTEDALQSSISCEIKYRDKFWDRYWTIRISKKEDIDPTTLRRMRARLQKSGQAKFCP